MSKINCKIFNIMGNHDNDPYCAGDWIAENKFREVVGPTYYSFNLGSIHYVVLDNVEYINTGGSQGVIGGPELQRCHCLCIRWSGSKKTSRKSVTKMHP